MLSKQVYLYIKHTWFNKRVESMLKAPNALKNDLKKLNAVFKTLAMKYFKKLHAAHKTLREKYLLMAHFTQHHHSALQRLKWVLVRGHANLAGSRKFLGCITRYRQFLPLIHSGGRRPSIYFFSFGSNKYKTLRPYVKNKKYDISHLRST